MQRIIIPALVATFMAGAAISAPASAQTYDQYRSSNGSSQGGTYSQNQPTASGNAWMNENDYDYNRRHWLPNRDQSQNSNRYQGQYDQGQYNQDRNTYDQNRNSYGQNQNNWNHNQGQYGQNPNGYGQNGNGYGQNQYNGSSNRGAYGQNQYDYNSRDRYGNQYQRPDQNSLGRAYRGDSRDYNDDND